MPEKLIYITEQNLRDAEKNRNATVDTNWLNDLNDLYNKTRHPNVKQIGDLPPGVGPDDSIFEPKEWFSNTTYYEYMDQSTLFFSYLFGLFLLLLKFTGLSLLINQVGLSFVVELLH